MYVGGTISRNLYPFSFVCPSCMCSCVLACVITILPRDTTFPSASTHSNDTLNFFPCSTRNSPISPANLNSTDSPENNDNTLTSLCTCAIGLYVCCHCHQHVITTKVTRSVGLGIECLFISQQNWWKTGFTILRIIWHWLTSVTNITFCYSSLSTTSTHHIMFSAHAHNWPS